MSLINATMPAGAGCTDRVSVARCGAKSSTPPCLRALGLDLLRLTYPHNGRAERATVNVGQIISEVFA